MSCSLDFSAWLKTRSIRVRHKPLKSRLAEEEAKVETWIKQEEIYKGKIFSLWGGQALLDNGEVVVREYIWHGGGVGMVPVIDGSVILIRQFRIAIGRELIELPSGRLEPDEEPIICAARELEEEIGY